MRPHRIALRARAIALMAAGMSCSEPAGPDITVNWIVVSTANNALAVAGVVNALQAAVIGPNDQPVRAGVRMRWLVPSGAGVVESEETETDAQGVARDRWTPPTAAGEYDIGVVVVGLPSATVTKTIVVHPAEPVRALLALDSLHFTRRSSKSVTLRLFDRYDNEHAFLPFGMQAISNGPFTGTFAGLQISVNPGSLARSSGEIAIETISGTVLARLKVGVAIGIKTVQLREVDADGLTVGETLPVTYLALDSGDVVVTATPEDIGLTLSSDDPAIVAVTSDLKLKGEGAGTTVVTLRAGNAEVRDTIEVFPAYDLGVRTTLYGIPGPFIGGPSSGHVFPYAPVFSTTGVSVLPVGRGSGSTMAWYDAQGTKLTERAWPGGNVASVAERWYVSSPLTALTETGSTVWTKEHSGVVGADADLVVIGTSTHAHAFSAAGDSAWSYAVSSATGIRLAPTRVFIQKDSTLSALDRSGQVVWTTSSFSAKVADEASNLYGASGAQWRGYDAAGSLRWTVEDGTIRNAAPGPNGSLILAGSDLRALDRVTGDERWRTDLGYSWSAIATVGDRVVVVAHRFLYVYDANSGALLGRALDRHQVGFTGTPLNGPVCTPAGLLFAAGAGYLFSRCP